MNFIYGSLDKKKIKVVTGCFIDLSKAFDTVDHDLLLEKLYRAGIRGVVQKLFKDYLSNRTQSVYVNGVMSTRRNISIGVPQGSVLGPTLFLIYINDLQYVKLKGRLMLYADDAAIFYGDVSARRNCIDLNHDLTELSNYFKKNLLTLNLSKTKYIHFCRYDHDVSDQIDIVLNDNVIEQVSEILYLGVWMDSKLSFKQHCEQVAKKVASATAALYKLRNVLPFFVLNQIYYSLIHSQLVYAVNVWGIAAKSHLNLVQVIQNRALKFIFGLPLLTIFVNLYANMRRQFFLFVVFINSQF